MSTDMQSETESKARGNVFISYSRANKAFARQVYLALSENGFTPLMDTQAINPAEPWQERLTSMIEECDSVVFVLTEPFLQSEPCQFEVEEAGRLGKRMIPLVPEPLGEVAVPDALARLNYIFFYENPNKPDSGFFTGVSELRRGLLVNLDWLREARIYGERAKDYFDTPDNERLLRGALLVHAQNWMEHCPDGEAIDADTRRYIERSARRENDRMMEREREVRARALRARLTLMAGAFLCVLAGIGAWMSFSYAMRAEAARSDQFATVSNELLRRGQSEDALLAALYGLPEDSLTTRFARLSGASFERVETAASVALERRAPPVSLELHDGEIRSIAVVPDFDLYVTAGADGYFVFTDSDRDGQTEYIPNFGGALRKLVIPADPKWVVAIDNAAVVARDMSAIRAALYGGPPPLDRSNLVYMSATDVAISPDGSQTAFVSDDGRVHLADTVSLHDFETVFDKDSFATRVAFAPDGQSLAIGTRTGRVEMFSLRSESMSATCSALTGSGDLVLNAPISALAFSPNGRFLMIGSRGKGAVRCSLSDWTTMRLSNSPEQVTAISFAPSGARFAMIGTGQDIVVYESGNLAHRDLLLQSRSPVTAIQFTPEGDHLIVGDGSGRLREVALDQADLGRSIDWTNEPITSIRHDCGGPNGTVTVSVSVGGQVAVHDATGVLIGGPVSRGNRPVSAMACAQGRPLVALANDLGEAHVLSLPQLEPVAEHSPRRRDGPILSLDFDAAAETLLIAHAAGYLHAFDIAEGRASELLAPELYIRNGAPGLTSAAYALGTAGEEAGGTPGILMSARSLGVINFDPVALSVHAASKTSAGNSIISLSATSHSGHVAYILKEAYEGDELSLVVHSSREGGILLSEPVDMGVSALAISPDGAFVALGRRDGSAAIYQVEGNLLRREYQLGGNAISSLSFSRDGRELAVATSAGRITILQTQAEALGRNAMLANACGHLDEAGRRRLDPQLAAIYRALATPISPDPCGPIWAVARED